MLKLNRYINKNWNSNSNSNSNGNENGNHHIASFLPSDQDNEEDIYRVAYRDKKGHSASLRISFHPAAVQAMEWVVDSRRFPLANIQELARAAVQWFMSEKLMKEEGEVDSVWTGYRLTLKEAQRAKYLSEHLEAMGELEVEIIQLRGRGHHAQAEEVIGRERAIIDAMPLGVWRTAYEERLDIIEKGGFSPLDPPKSQAAPDNTNNSNDT